MIRIFIASASACACCAMQSFAAPRVARTLPGAQVAAAVTNAPAGAKISVPERAARTWSAGEAWRPGDVATHSNAVYVCIQGHKSQSDWSPHAVPALWRLVRAATDAPGKPPAWRQPQGAHDAYAKDSRVTYKDSVWISTIAANVWAPGVYGWVRAQ